MVQAAGVRTVHISDPLREIFSQEVMRHLLRHLPGDYHLAYRLNVLGASGPAPSDPRLAGDLELLRAEKAAWEAYLDAAFLHGFFEEESGSDLRGRLGSPDYEQFRSAMDECATVWLFAGPLRLRPSPRPGGSNASKLEMLVHHAGGEFNVEVKSPFNQVEPVPGVAHFGHGDDSEALSQCLEQAAKQFAKGQPNVLVIFPRFMLPVTTSRRMILNAFYGQDMIHIPIDKTTGEATGSPYVAFRQDGHMLKVRRSEGKPRYTRVSAVLTIEPRVKDIPLPSGRVLHLMVHDVLVAHNPYAERPVSRAIWGDWPQLVHEDNSLCWTDGHSLTGWDE